MQPARGASVLALDANALELFARIAAAGSFAQAARELGITRAAVSRRVAGLEQQLGTALFARTTRALGLTEAGRRLAGRARAVHEAAENARRSFRRGAGAVAGHSGLAGTLRITSVAAFGESVLAPLLARFQSLHPALRLELRLTYRRMDLLRDEVDVAFRLTSKPPPDWVAQPVMPMEVRAYAAPREGLPLAHPQALEAEACLLFGPPVEQATLHWQHQGRAGERAARAGGRSGSARAPNAAAGTRSARGPAAPRTASASVTVEPALMADDLGTLSAIARAGRGIVCLPDFMATRWLAAGALVDALPGWHLLVPEGDQVQALTLPQPESPEAARALVRFVREALAG